MPFQIDGRGDMNAFVLTSPLAGVMLLTRRQPFYPSAAHDKFFSICTAFGGYTEFGIVPRNLVRPPPSGAGWWAFHFQAASFFKFMAANLSFTQLVTWVKPLY